MPLVMSSSSALGVSHFLRPHLRFHYTVTTLVVGVEDHRGRCSTLLCRSNTRECVICLFTHLWRSFTLSELSWSSGAPSFVWAWPLLNRSQLGYVRLCTAMPDLCFMMCSVAHVKPSPSFLQFPASGLGLWVLRYHLR